MIYHVNIAPAVKVMKMIEIKRFYEELLIDGLSAFLKIFLNFRRFDPHCSRNKKLCPFTLCAWPIQFG